MIRWKREVGIVLVAVALGAGHALVSGRVLGSAGREVMLPTAETRPGSSSVPHFLLMPALVRAHEAAAPGAMVHEVQYHRVRGGDRFYVVKKTDGVTRWRLHLSPDGTLRRRHRIERIPVAEVPRGLLVDPPELGMTPSVVWHSVSEDSTTFTLQGISPAGVLVEWTRTEAAGGTGGGATAR